VHSCDGFAGLVGPAVGWVWILYIIIIILCLYNTKYVLLTSISPCILVPSHLRPWCAPF
jgi:hypothetical protein